ncbi:unnamed protein product [Euphydryas editha]|uniref:Uncharacterized protein n=1 Tax=Euphydryas editha TaxID=104508 RepID=A0AAU9V3A3_EUPED|nr:unnamed protein product [Euphydryas editha]
MSKKAYGESAMSITRVYVWYKRFQDGREEVEDDERPGCLSTSRTNENMEKGKEMVLNDRRIIIREVTDGVGISVSSCHKNFTVSEDIVQEVVEAPELQLRISPDSYSSVVVQFDRL